MKIFNGGELKSAEFFSPKTTGRANVQMGTAVMKAHTEGDFDAHPGDEYSYILSGKLICYTGDGEEYNVQAGDAIFTPAGQKHKSKCISDEDCAVVWIEVAL